MIVVVVGNLIEFQETIFVLSKELKVLLAQRTPWNSHMEHDQYLNSMLLGSLVIKVFHGNQNLRISSQKMARDMLVSGLVNLA